MADGASFLTEKYGPLPGWGWAAVAAGGVVLYRLWKNRQAGAAGASALAGPATTATPEPTTSVSLPGGGSYSGPASGISSFFCLTNPAACGLGGGATPTGAGATTPSSPTPSPGPSLPPTIGIGGQQYYVLGTAPPAGQTYSGYQVAGGAPVFGGNADQISEGAAVTTPGNVLYTPVTYGNLIYGGPSKIPSPI